MQVDLTFSGHTHLSERTLPVFHKTYVPPAEDGSNRAPVHVILGNAGQVLLCALCFKTNARVMLWHTAQT